MDAIFTSRARGVTCPISDDTAAFNAYMRDRLSDMIDQEVMIAVAKQYKAEVDDKEIAPDVDKQLKELHGRFKSDAEFRTQLKAEGFGTETDLRNSLLDKPPPRYAPADGDGFAARARQAGRAGERHRGTRSRRRSRKRATDRQATRDDRVQADRRCAKANSAERAGGKGEGRFAARRDPEGRRLRDDRQEGIDGSRLEGRRRRAAVRAAREDGRGVRSRDLLGLPAGHGHPDS